MLIRATPLRLAPETKQAYAYYWQKGRVKEG